MRDWIAYSFKDSATREERERELLTRSRRRGRPPSNSLALQGYAAGLFSTVGLTRSELHVTFLEIGWAQADERDWWRDARRAVESLQRSFLDRGGKPPPLQRGPLPPDEQRLRSPDLALLVDEESGGALDGEPLSIVTSVRVESMPTHRPAGETRGKEWAVAWAVSRLRSIAEPHWVADLFGRSSVCRGVAVEAAIAWQQARAVRFNPGVTP